MADRYWVGGSGSWNSTTKWSTTSGGASGASVPTASDNAIFDANSGTSHYIVTVTDNATCANLTFTPHASDGVTQFAVGVNFVIAGTFSTSGTQGNRRAWFRSSTYGLMRDMQIATIGTVTDVDFRDIRVTGTGGTLTGTRIGDLRGNVGITFSTPKNCYRIGTGNWSDDQWSDTSGGSPNTDFFPLAQDTAVFDENTTGGTHSFTSAYNTVGSFDASARTSALTVSLAAAQSVYGNWTFGSGITISGLFTLTFSGRNTQVITSAGKAFSGGITIDSYGGTVELADALNIGSTTLTVTNGTFDTKNYNVTANTLSSSNSNVRAINLGSSTVTLNGSTGVAMFTSTNLTFSAGTSLISLGGSAVTFSGGGMTFYDVTFTGTLAATKTISNANTFNNLTITATSSEGLTEVSFEANQTINGTLTVAGATAVRRIFLRTSNLSAPRTLTVNSLSADDCDFRDITIAGTAAGASPTRAGDCGRNTGITFPAPKTVYWNLSGAQSWSATAWATSSGGTPAVNNFPLAQDTAVFDNTGSVTGDISINANWNIGTFDASGRTSAMTLTNSGNSPRVYGDWKFGTGVSSVSTTGAITFSKRGTQTITSNGITFGCDIAIDSFSGTVQLADALTLLAARTLSLLSGTFDAVTYNVTTGIFRSDTTSFPRTLRMGSGTWTISGTGSSAWNIAASNFTLFKGTANILFSDTSTASRSFNGGGLSYNKLTIGGTTGTSALTIVGNNQFTELASTKTVAHTIALGTTIQTFGAWTVTGTAGNVVTLTGSGTSHILAGACTSGIDYLAMGSIGFAATSPGEFYAGANSTGTAAAPVYRTAKPADSTRYWVGGTGNWSDTARWSTSSGGASGASVPRSHDDVVFDSASNATAYTATVNAVTGGIRTKALTIAGPASGNVTLAGSIAIVGVHGDVTFPATGLTRTYTGSITLSGTGAGKTITTNGVALANAITVNGVGAEWALADALNIGTNDLTVTNGSFGTANYNLTFQSLTSNSDHSRIVDFGSSTVAISFNLNFGTTENNRANLTFTAGTSQINLSNGGPTLSGNNQTFYNVSFTSTALVTPAINGSNTFNNLSVAGRASVGVSSVVFNADQTINGTLTLSAGDFRSRTFVRSNTAGTTRTLTCAAVASLTDIDFRDIAIAGAAVSGGNLTGTRLGDCKGNSGITFDAAKTVYWNFIVSRDWGTNSWAASEGGTVGVDFFPLAQDTAIFPAGQPNSGSIVTINAAYNIGTIDMSARTSNTMTLATSTTAPSIYGNWINGTGTTLSGSGILFFYGSGGTTTITSAGKTFTQPLSIVASTGTVRLLDALTIDSASGGITLNSGTFDANNYNVSLFNTANMQAASGSEPRTLAIGSGTWTVAVNSASAWNTGGTGFTVTGTGTISLTGSSSKTFTGNNVDYSGITLNQGGAGTLTITGNNRFANITNTYSATGATTINMGTTTQTVGNFTASGEAGRVLTIQGTSATSPARLIFSGSGQATQPTTDYLTITGVRAYSLDTTWYAGANSTNNGSLGWYFEAGGVEPILVYIIESATASSTESSLGTFNPTISESATAADVVDLLRVFLASVSESATSSDLISAALTLSASIAELTTGSDSAAVESRVSFPAVAEFAAAADVPSSSLLFLSSISEVSTAQEIATAVLIFNRAVNEATTASEILVAVAAFNAVVPESVTGTDVANALTSFGGFISEALTALDVAVAANSSFTAILESAAAQEATANVYTANPVVAETAISLDAAQGAYIGFPSLSEGATASETPATQLTAGSVVVEASTAQETAAPNLLLVTGVVEAATLADSSSVASTFGVVALAAAQAAESFSPAGSVYNAALPVESAGITDFLVGAYLWNPIDDSQTASWQNVNNTQTPTWANVNDGQTPGWNPVIT